MATKFHNIRIQGGNTPGVMMEVQVPGDAPQHAIETAKTMYNYGGNTQYIWLNSVKNETTTQNNSSSDSGTDFATGVFQLVGWGITTTATVGYLGVTKVAYPATKFVVTKAVVPATVFTGKYTWKGMKYVANTTVPQVYSFTKNTVVPGVIKVATDIVTFIKELIQKVLNK